MYLNECIRSLVITGYLNYKNAIWWAVLNTIFITLANHASLVKSVSPQGCYYWLLLAIKSHQSFFSVPTKQQMVRGSLMALAPVIAKHTHKQVAQVQSHRGLIRDRRTKTSVYKRNMSAASDGGPSQSHYLLYKSSKLKMICCQELMFVNLFHSLLQFKTPVAQISVIISQMPSHKHCINIKGRLCSMRDYLYSQWQLNTHSRPFPHIFPLQWVHQSSLVEMLAFICNNRRRGCYALVC